MVAFRPDGADPQAPAKLLAGFLHMLAAAALLGLLLRRAGSAGYGARFGTAVVFGLAASLFAHLGQPIWFDLPWGYYLSIALYDLVAWLIAGAVLAYFVQPETA